MMFTLTDGVSAVAQIARSRVGATASAPTWLRRRAGK